MALQLDRRISAEIRRCRVQEGILEHYWGEHIHLGHYSDAERAAVEHTSACEHMYCVASPSSGLVCLNLRTGLQEEGLHPGEVRLHRPDARVREHRRRRRHHHSSNEGVGRRMWDWWRCAVLGQGEPVERRRCILV